MKTESTAEKPKEPSLEDQFNQLRSDVCSLSFVTAPHPDDFVRLIDLNIATLDLFAKLTKVALSLVERIEFLERNVVTKDRLTRSRV